MASIEQDDDGGSGALELADYLADLRRELLTAEAAARDEQLKFHVASVEVDLTIGYVREVSGGGEAKAHAKFLVFEFGEASVSGSVKFEHSTVQHLKLTLTPQGANSDYSLDVAGTAPRSVAGGGGVADRYAGPPDEEDRSGES